MPTQDFADTHEMAPSPAATCLAGRIVDQREPFHRSVRVPVITQNRRDVQDTALGNTCFGSSRTDHLEPFHAPLIPRAKPVKLDAYTTIPTATQNRREPHETSDHSLCPPAGDAIGWTNHTTPFHRSARTVPLPPG